MIDWNRARKRLSTFLDRDDAIQVLRWAADENVGHMSFLVMGGERLIYDAVELAAKGPARYGETLTDVLGREPTLEVTRFALRAAAEGLTAGKSHLLIRDELRVEVMRHVEAAQQRFLDAVSEHASLVVETARGLQTALVHLGTPLGEGFVPRAADRRAWLGARGRRGADRFAPHGRANAATVRTSPRSWRSRMTPSTSSKSARSS